LNHHPGVDLDIEIIQSFDSTKMKRWWNKPRFDLLEIVVISLSMAVFLHVLILRHFYPAPPERLWFSNTYGPAHNSQYEEEWLIRDFFHDRRNGFFVDVGANDYRVFSNTYYLETALGWSGLAIEPQRQYEGDYHRYRPRSRFLPFFISDVSNQEATMYYVKNNPFVTSSDKAFTEQYGTDAGELHAPTITLNDLFARESVTKIDLLSVDIELGEPKALKGLDIDRFRPALVCIEAHEEVRQQILDYFARHHYGVVGRYLRVDTENLYFSPAAD
jgi:FkbM family methyltransferase